MFLTAILPISERYIVVIITVTIVIIIINFRSGINLMGQINTTNVTDYETIQDFNNNKLINDNDDSNMDIDIANSNTSNEINSDIDYELYQKFWKLQGFFSDENKTFESVQKFKDFRRYHHHQQ
jgi:hypothetical protein